DELGNVGKALTVEPPRQVRGNPPSDTRPVVNHRRVELDEARARTDALPRVVGSGDAADPDQRDLAAARAPELAQGFEGKRLQRRAGEPSCLGAEAGLERRSSNSGVRDDNSVDLVVDR